jgi:cytochrome c-type biogenesis protein CcsB
VELAPLQLAWVGYLAAAFGYVLHLLRADDTLRRIGPRVLSIAFVLHSLFFVIRIIQTGTVPANHITEGMALFTWLVVGVYLLVEKRFALDVLGAVISPMAFVLTFMAFAFYSGEETVPLVLRSPGLVAHIVLAFAGNAVFAIAFAVSVIYLLQERQLKARSRGWLIRRLPSLERLDRMGYGLLLWGFALMTAGILSGGIWAAANSGNFWTWEPREVLSAISWVLLAVLLQMRAAGGLRGRRAARYMIVAFVIVLTSYLAVNLLPLGGLHGGGLNT